ncbi:MAG: SGNH/GDSL hydrolase family protein, partial [Planctomycetota bacterium]
LDSVARQKNVRPHRTQRRIWLRRTMAVLLGCTVIFATEQLCEILGLGAAEVGDDPYVEFAARRPLFVLSDDNATIETSEQRLGFFRQVSFARVKPRKEFRIFVIGGSTVQGHPYSIETSFPACLQSSLTCADASRSWKVINCGGVSYASYRLVPVLNECLQYQPDLIVFCEGHNEFLEDVTYASIRSQPHSQRWLGEIADQSRLVRLLRERLFSKSSSMMPESRHRAILTEEVDTILNHAGGLEAYHRDDFRASAVADHFRINLIRMSDLCALHGIPLLVVRPPANLADCPPFKSQFSTNTGPESQTEIFRLLRNAQQLSATDLNTAIDSAKRATDLDPRYALGWYELGQLLLTRQEYDRARTALQRACDEDVCPLRMTSPLAQIMSDVVAERQIPFVDANHLLEIKTATGILGDQWLVDHVHPSFVGHEEIAIAITRWMMAASILQPVSKTWEEDARRTCRDELQSLSDLYFLKGQQRLELLRRWAAGRATEPWSENASNL